MMGAIYILWLRELKRYTRSRSQLIASLGQPILYLLALGFGLGPVFRKAGEGSYMQFVSPGIIAMVVLFAAMFSGIALLWDRQFGFLKETLVAPVPRVSIMIGRSLGGATVAIVQGTLMSVACLIAGFRPATLASLPMGLLFMVLIATLFVAMGVAMGSGLQDMQGFQLIMSFLVMPIFFFSGALFPLDGLPRWLAAAAEIDPLTYGVDGMRHALTGTGHFSTVTDLVVLVAVAGALVCLGAWRFSRIEV